MRILFLGDVVGKPGRQALAGSLPKLRNELKPSLVIANGENAAGGFGLTERVLDEIFDAGVDLVTSGNHVWDKKEFLEVVDNYEFLLRPANYPPGVPGRGHCLIEVEPGQRVGVINLSGRVFLDELDCPFRIADSLVEELRASTRVILIDFHAEATSEKIALGWHLNGRVSALIGSHTHVQTADERVLSGGTAYITDMGMVGPRDGVIGVRRRDVLHRFMTQMPAKFEVEKGPVLVCGVLVDISVEDGRASSINRVARVWDPRDIL